MAIKTGAERLQKMHLRSSRRNRTTPLRNHFIREFALFPTSNILRSSVVKALLWNQRDVGSIPAGGSRMDFSQRSWDGFNNGMFMPSFFVNNHHLV